MSNRTSTLPKRVFKIKTPQLECISCGKELLSGFVYTGSVLDGIGYATKTSVEIIRKVPLLLAEVSKNCSFLRRKKGSLCTDCASDYTTYDWRGTLVPRVMTDPVPGFIGVTVAGHSVRSDKQGDIG
jgi:hypothetical protein